MNYQKMRIDFMQKRKTTAPFVYKTGEIDSDGIEAELVNIDVEGSPIGFIKVVSPNGAERESALRIENGFAYFDIPKNEEGLYTVELTILNKKNKTRSGNIAIEVINSLSYDSEEYETLLDTITKNDAEYTSNENIRIKNENTRIETFDEIKTDFENLTAGKQLDSEVIIARNGKASLKDNIESKRDKSTLLTQSDISTSSESHKLTMNHLSQEVKNAIAGTAPVSPNISDGQVSTEKVANNAITFSKIGNEPSNSKTVITSLDGIVKDGSYRFSSATSAPATGSGIVQQTTHWTGVGTLGNKTQTVNMLDTFGTMYFRYTNSDTTVWSGWKKIWPVETKKDWNFANKVTLASGTDLAALEDSGAYNLLINGQYSNYPNQPLDVPTTSTTLILSVFREKNGQTAYQLQTIQKPSAKIKPEFWIGYKWYNEAEIVWSKVILGSADKKKLCLLGDSIMRELDTKVIADITGTIVFQDAIGGSTIAKFPTTNEALDKNALVTRTKVGASFPVDVEGNDIFAIWSGTNDFKNGMPIGQINSTNEQEILGALNITIKQIQERNPKAVIVVITPQYRAESENTIANRNLLQICKAIEEQCSALGVPCKNAHEFGIVNKYNMSTMLDPDQLHLSNVGAEIITRQHANFIKQYI